MDEGNSAGIFPSPVDLNQTQNLFHKPFEKPKPAARRVHKKKAILGQLRKKHNEEKSRKTGKARNSADDQEQHEWPGLISSTSATESATEVYKKKLTVATKTGRNHINFAKFEDSIRTTPFVFQKKLSRIDWRKLHTIDVDKIVREVDLDTLEAVVDTIAFSDIQGEDTRNFTEANFVKIFRLAQLMVEYMLHVQELLASQKSQLLADGTTIQRRMEKHKEKFAKILRDLTQSRHDLKQAKKTLRVYETMLKLQGEQQQQSVTQHMVRCCPLCDKMFESSYYLDLHIARRHPKPDDVPEDKILAVVSKAEEATAARVKAETTAALQIEIQHLRSMSQVEIQRTEAAAQFQIATLQANLRESNSKVQEVQNKLEQLQTQLQNSPLTSARKNGVPVEKKVKDTKTQEKLKELGEQLQRLQKELRDLTKEKTNLMTELESTKSEVSLLKSENRKSVVAERKADHVTDLWQNHQMKTHGKKGKIVEDLERVSSTTSDGQDQVMEDENISDTSSARTERKDRRTRRKHRKNRSSPVSNEEYKQGTRKKLKERSSPERKRKQRLPDDERNTLQRSSLLTRHNDSASPKQSKDANYEVPDENTPKLSARLRLADKEIFGVAKADLELDLARAEEKRLGILEVGKVDETKKTRRETEKTPGRQRHIQEKETAAMTREKRRLEAEKEMERLANKTAEEERRRRLEIAAAASMDVGEDGPIIPVSEKEKWLQERPFKPIPQRPHVVSKYPHPPSVFQSKRDDLVNRLDAELGGELRKFGFSSDTEGISDSIHQAATAALEKQNKHRASVLQTNQKKSFEYERGAIVWHTQRAVRERDIQIIESHFEEESDECSSRSGVSGRGDSPFTDDEDDEHSMALQQETSKRTPIVPQIRDQYYNGDMLKREGHVLGESQPGVSQSNGSSDKKQVNYSANSYSRKQMNRFKMQTQSPNGSHFDFQHLKDNSSVQLSKQNSPPWGDTKGDAVEDNERETEFGLGQWESDGEMHTQVFRHDTKDDKAQCMRTQGNFSDDGSEESKIFKELDAEIDEIIRL